MSNQKSTVNVPNNFGNGECYGGAVHAADSGGNPVTIANNSKGETFISSGHISNPSDFWGYRSDGAKGHDHFKADGSSDFNGHSGDRGRSE